MKERYFPRKYNGSWWICYGTPTSFSYLYRHSWDGCSKDYPQGVCDQKNNELLEDEIEDTIDFLVSP